MRGPADGEDGECCPKYILRIETGVHARCVVEGIVLVFVFGKLGFVTQRAGRLSVGRYFREQVLSFCFYVYAFIVNVVRDILPFLKMFVCNVTRVFT